MAKILPVFFPLHRSTCKGRRFDHHATGIPSRTRAGLFLPAQEAAHRADHRPGARAAASPLSPEGHEDLPDPGHRQLRLARRQRTQRRDDARADRLHPFGHHHRHLRARHVHPRHQRQGAEDQHHRAQPRRGHARRLDGGRVRPVHRRLVPRQLLHAGAAGGRHRRLRCGAVRQGGPLPRPHRGQVSGESPLRGHVPPQRRAGALLRPLPLAGQRPGPRRAPEPAHGRDGQADEAPEHHPHHRHLQNPERRLALLPERGRAGAAAGLGPVAARC